MQKTVDFKNGKNVDYKFLAPSYKNRIQEVFKVLDKKHLILDIGCGNGKYHKFLKNSIVLDRETNDLKKIKSLNNSVILADAEEIPIKDNSIQTIICINTLEYIENFENTFKEVFRILEHNARFILTLDNHNYPFIFDPINYFRKILRLKPMKFGAWNWKQLRRFKKEEIENYLKKSGFKIEKTVFISHYLICCLNYLECGFYNFFLSEEYKDSYMLNKQNKNLMKRDMPHFFVSSLDILSKIVCHLDNFLFTNANGANILIIAKKEKK